ncbi:hypothetical protein LWI28_023629 [Acer negundo]|uniref:Uncharacterized protein n=1 Tax=Acer negundo TaxID=4023 RepID=A0AAD5P1P6_ACENE|nr:hypothetical protein LWI28_023629 [Acer negundo]
MDEEDVDDKRSGANASAPLSEAQDELVMGEVERQREMPLLAIPIQNSAILLLMTLTRLVLKLLTILPGSCRGKTSSVEGVTHSFDPQSIAVGPSEVPSLSGCRTLGVTYLLSAFHGLVDRYRSMSLIHLAHDRLHGPLQVRSPSVMDPICHVLRFPFSFVNGQFDPVRPLGHFDFLWVPCSAFEASMALV